MRFENFRAGSVKFRVTAVAVACIVLTPAMAVAVSPFTDVIPGKFYEAPVEWALDSGITNGKSPTTFEPDSPVTSGETVTFLKRYNDNVVKQTVGSLVCSATQMAVLNGTDWVCNKIAAGYELSAGPKTATGPSGMAGTHSSIVIGNDYLPIVSYHDSTSWNLAVFHCKSADCSNGVGTATTLDATGSVGTDTLIVIGDDHGQPLWGIHLDRHW